MVGQPGSRSALARRPSALPRSRDRSTEPGDESRLPFLNAMKEGLLGDRLDSVHRGASSRGPVFVLHAGLGLSRRRLGVCLLSGQGELVEEFAVPSERDGVGGLARRVLERGQSVRGVIESMTGARFVYDTLEREGWGVLIADAQRVKGLAPLACKTDRIDARVLAVLSERGLVPAIWLPDPAVRRERERARLRLQLVKQRSMLKAPGPTRR
jgi:hypothetical protein